MHPMSAVTAKKTARLDLIATKYGALSRASPNFAPKSTVNRGELFRYVNDVPRARPLAPSLLNLGTGLSCNEFAMQFDLVAFFHSLSLIFLAPDARWASVAP
jgi:hypothetical protein